LTVKLEDHCLRTAALYGRRDEDIHKILDAEFSTEGSAHRRKRHTLEYVLRKLRGGIWTVEEARSAIQHIIDDCGRIMMADDWKEAKDFIKEAVL
jgi:hypothetical protein